MWHKLIHQFIALLFFASASTVEINLQMERFEQVSGFHLLNTTGLRVRKFNRTTWVLDGEGDLFHDLGDEYFYTLTVAYSRLGNNQFNDSPLKVPKDTMCNMLNAQYKENQEYFLNWTNFPRVGDERFCPFPKGHYWAKNFAPEGGWVPPFVPEGYWRLTAEISSTKDTIKIETYIRIIKSYA